MIMVFIVVIVIENSQFDRQIENWWKDNKWKRRQKKKKKKISETIQFI